MADFTDSMTGQSYAPGTGAVSGGPNPQDPSAGGGNQLSGWGLMSWVNGGLTGNVNPEGTPQIDYSGVSGPVAASEQGRRGQGQAFSQASQLAAGKGPSAATELLKNNAQESMAEQNALASSGSGSIGQGLSRRQAMMANQRTMSQLGGQASLARATEQLGGLQMEGSLAGQQRGQDIQTAGLYGDLATKQAELANAAANRNEQAQEANQKAAGNIINMVAGAAAGALAFLSDPKGKEDVISAEDEAHPFVHETRTKHSGLYKSEHVPKQTEVVGVSSPPEAKEDSLDASIDDLNPQKPQSSDSGGGGGMGDIMGMIGGLVSPPEAKTAFDDADTLTDPDPDVSSSQKPPETQASDGGQASGTDWTKVLGGAFAGAANPGGAYKQFQKSKMSPKSAQPATKGPVSQGAARRADPKTQVQDPKAGTVPSPWKAGPPPLQNAPTPEGAAVVAPLPKYLENYLAQVQMGPTDSSGAQVAYPQDYKEAFGSPPAAKQEIVPAQSETVHPSPQTWGNPDASLLSAKRGQEQGTVQVPDTSLEFLDRRGEISPKAYYRMAGENYNQAPQGEGVEAERSGEFEQSGARQMGEQTIRPGGFDPYVHNVMVQYRREQEEAKRHTAPHRMTPEEYTHEVSARRAALERFLQSSEGEEPGNALDRAQTDFARTGNTDLSSPPQAKKDKKPSDSRSQVAALRKFYDQAESTAPYSQMEQGQKYREGQVSSPPSAKMGVNPGKIESALRVMHPYSYRYKDPRNEPVPMPTGNERFFGVMTTDLKKHPITKSLVFGQGANEKVSVPAATSFNLASGAHLQGVADNHESRLLALEKIMSAPRSKGMRSGKRV